MSVQIPLIDISTLRSADPAAQKRVAEEIGRACEEFGFFCIAGHGVAENLQSKLETLSKKFFSQSPEEKMRIEMQKGGRAWRGFFPVGAELTSGKPDLKEGIYFGEELPREDPRVAQKLPLHGKNLFPNGLPEFKETVLEYMECMTELGHLLMKGISLSLGLTPDYFLKHYTQDPTLLFRIFHYPPTTSQNEKQFPWGVGEHTDYGLLAILKQDDCGGLQIKMKQGWIDVPPTPNTFVCNIGDMLDYLTRGKYLSAPHRVKNTSGRDRYSYPFFFDPGFSAKIGTVFLVPNTPTQTRDRWDQADLHAFQGTYGEYLLSKISKVFPYLAKAQL